MKNVFNRFVLISGVLLSAFLPGRSEEGMWLPALLDQYNVGRMQLMGSKLSATDIYSVNQACLKDAVVIFGNGCTGELVSSEGLVFTNHHCGLDQIQKHSTEQNDYLTNGFWALTKEQELPNPGLTVTFLVRMEDVTDQILEALSGIQDPKQQEFALDTRRIRIENEAVAGTRYKAVVKPFYYGNQFILLIYDEFRDVRLVGAPPGAIGKFGGDTDNWMWPRHTGDFSVFRIYADKNNNPADYSPGNVPYKPVKYLPISLKGVKENDFTMVMGYPGTTQQFLPSAAVKLQMEQSLPDRIAIRSMILHEYEDEMNLSNQVRIQYTVKQARLSNAWKKWVGSLKGLNRVGALERKMNEEKEFIKWAEADSLREYKYGNILPFYERVYSDIAPYTKASDFFREAILGIELVSFVSSFRNLLGSTSVFTDEGKLATQKASLQNSIDAFFKDYYLPVDRKLATLLIQHYLSQVPKEFHPDIIQLIHSKYKGNVESYVNEVYAKSIFVNRIALKEEILQMNEKTISKLKKDPAWLLFESFSKLYNEKVYPQLDELGKIIAVLNSNFVIGLMEMQSSRKFYPDANFTMRVAYGKVEGYKPGDAVYYQWYTTLDGIIEKEDPEVYDYIVPQKLKELYFAKDYGRYGANGTMPVCFLASNHTSGGNSGSPVLNAQGQLIGINFDRNWEGTMSDILYDISLCRNISVDIRYVLFVIEKVGGATNIIQELTLID